MVSLVPRPQPPAPTAPTPKTSKSLLRRATLSGSIRKGDDRDVDDLFSSPPSPRKRARVTFNPKVEEKVLDEYSVKGQSLDVVRAETKRAIEAHLRGDSEAYDNIKEVFAPRNREDEDAAERRVDMKTYLAALNGYASMLNKNCSGLVKAVLRCEWMGRDEAFVKTYVQFLGSLASAQGSWVGMVLTGLVENFSGMRLSSGRLEGCPDVNRDQLSSRIHKALKYLLQLIPAASGTLSTILASKYPYHDDSKTVHLTYIKNLIRLIDYAPELKSDVFALITDRLVKIDVQMQLDLEDTDDEVTAGVLEATTSTEKQMEADEHDDSDVDSATSDEEDPHDKRVREASENVQKLDAILDLLFTTYTPYFADENSLEAISMFENLLAQFQNIILPIQKTRHTQFLLFHFTQTSRYFIDHFVATCADLAFRPGQPAVLKQSAASYLASFVARGTHVQPRHVHIVFSHFDTHLHNIRIENEDTCRGPDLRRYSTFYAMTQALLYIFCFRWRDLIVSPKQREDEDLDTFLAQDLVWVPGTLETLQNAISSKLNPLKVCTPVIVKEFARIAHHVRFMYVFSLLETNKLIRLSQYSSGSGAGNGHNNESWHRLESYFPFDPYQLPVSKRWLEDDYVHWEGIPGLDRDEKSKYESEYESEREGEGEEEDKSDWDGDTLTDVSDSEA